jgi:DNA-binding NtrC family response regulator
MPANDSDGMSAAERQRSIILVIEPEPNDRSNFRNTIRDLGFGTITDVPNHAQGLERIRERAVTHIIFDARSTNMPTVEFVEKALEQDSNLILIPASWEPNVDAVFDMLILGARGYLVKPFTVDSVENAIVSASKGEPIADAVRQAKDRNEALVAIMMSSLDKTATVLRQAQKFETAKREVPRCMSAFRRASELARMFARDGDDGLMESLEKFCLERSQGPASRLGRLRKRLKGSRLPGQL